MKTIHPLLKARKAVGLWADCVAGLPTIFLIDLKSTIFFFLIYYIYLWTCWGARVEIRRQPAGVDFLLPPRGPQGSNGESQAWWQAHLPIKPLCLQSSVSFADSRLLTFSGSSSGRSLRPYPFYSFPMSGPAQSPNLSLCILSLPNASALCF